MTENIADAAIRHFECVSFYNREARLLDEHRLEEWLDLLTEDVEYTMPIRVTRERGSERSEFSERTHSYNETRQTLEARVKRFQTEFAWSEDPPSRVRHFVSNVDVRSVDGDELFVSNYVLLHRGQGEEPEAGVYLTGERKDIIRRVDGDLKLAEREILLDHTRLPMRNLTIFL